MVEVGCCGGGWEDKDAGACPAHVHFLQLAPQPVEASAGGEDQSAGQEDGRHPPWGGQREDGGILCEVSSAHVVCVGFKT